jgi:hypothetical protein
LAGLAFLCRRNKMTDQDPTERQPKGDHNRRVAMAVDPDEFAAEAGITTEQLREYERTSPDHRFDADVAERVGAALERLEAKLPNFETARSSVAPGFTKAQIGQNGPTEPLPEAQPTGPRYTSGADDE